MKISTARTEVTAFLGKELVRSKIVINRKYIQQINAFWYLGTEISHMGEVGIQKKMVKL